MMSTVMKAKKNIPTIRPGDVWELVFPRCLMWMCVPNRDCPEPTRPPGFPRKAGIPGRGVVPSVLWEVPVEATNEASMHNWFLGPPCTYSNLQISVWDEMSNYFWYLRWNVKLFLERFPWKSSYHSAPFEKVFVNYEVGPRVYRYKWNDIFPIAMAENKWVSTRWAPTNDKSGEIPTPGSKVIVPVAYIAI